MINRGMENARYEAVMAEMASIARDRKRSDVLECFSESILRVFIGDQGSSPSAAKVFARLEASVDARAELQELERGMDKEHFVELVTGGHVIYGGVDKQTKLPILWYRSGSFNREAWRYVYGSPRGKAFIRYVE